MNIKHWRKRIIIVCCVSDVRGREQEILPNMCVYGIMMEQEISIKFLLVQFSFLFTPSVAFLLGFVQVFFIAEIS